MSAPSIPNLHPLGSGTSRGNGRGGRRGRQVPEPCEDCSTPSATRDATIQGTDTDAAVSRLSAVEMGYLDDPFAECFVQRTLAAPTRRLPIINRGTYTRTTALDGLIDLFLSSACSSDERQIVSLGAGTDTRALRLFSRAQSRHGRRIHYHEIDYCAVVQRKISLVQSSPRLRRVLGDPAPFIISASSTSWHANSPIAQGCTLHSHGLDLRDLVSSTPSTSSPLPHLFPNMPTLVLSECCLCYLPTAHATALLSRFVCALPNVGLVIYEPVFPHDPFGRIMVTNLAARGISMPTLETYPTPADHARRLREAGLAGGSDARTIDEIWARWVPGEEKARIERLEMLDEMEEWKLLAGHYVVAWGWKGDGFEGWKQVAEVGLPTGTGGVDEG